MTNLPKHHQWYVQDPKVFRQKIWKWLDYRCQGGEVGRFLTRFLKRHELTPQRQIARMLNASRLSKGIAVAIAITTVGIFLKKDSSISVAEVIFDNLESIALGTAAVIFLIEAPERRKQDRSEAWKAISLARGELVNANRVEALQKLNQYGEDLRRIDLSNCDLSDIDLSGSKLKLSTFVNTTLSRANLAKADLENTDLSNANLVQADLRGAYLRYACLQDAQFLLARLGDADLGGANLERLQGESTFFVRANLRGVNLKEANLKSAYLRESFLVQASLQKANLAFSNLEKADLREANLQEVTFAQSNLKEANLKNAKLAGADLKWAKGVTHSQLSQAKLCLTRLPDDIRLESNRDCEELGIDPETGDFLEAVH